MMSVGDRFMVNFPFVMFDGKHISSGDEFMITNIDYNKQMCMIQMHPGALRAYYTEVSHYDLLTHCSPAMAKSGLAAWLPTPAETANFWSVNSDDYKFAMRKGWTGTVKLNLDPKCECGSEIAGSSRHSSWCPKHDPH